MEQRVDPDRILGLANPQRCKIAKEVEDSV